jgi:DNA mismatch endonuclease (patch repair protein)
MHIKAPTFKLFHPASKISSIIKSKNRSKNTRAELVLRNHIWKLGLRYRLHVPDLPGKPDLAFASAKVVIFCDGDFWHGRNWKKLRQELKGRKNSKYWIPKIAANIHRDLLQKSELENMGWRVVRLWETDILKDPTTAAAKIKGIVRGDI